MALNLQIIIPTGEIEEKVKEILSRYGDKIKTELTSRTPGKASQKWKIIQPTEESVIISNDTKYLSYLEHGTGIYGPGRVWIKPKTASVLSWMDENRRVFAKQVKGMPAKPFVRSAIRAGMIAAREEKDDTNI